MCKYELCRSGKLGALRGRGEYIVAAIVPFRRPGYLSLILPSSKDRRGPWLCVPTSRWVCLCRVAPISVYVTLSLVATRAHERPATRSRSQPSRQTRPSEARRQGVRKTLRLGLLTEGGMLQGPLSPVPLFVLDMPGTDRRRSCDRCGDPTNPTPMGFSRSGRPFPLVGF